MIDKYTSLPHTQSCHPAIRNTSLGFNSSGIYTLNTHTDTQHPEPYATRHLGSAFRSAVLIKHHTTPLCAYGVRVCVCVCELEGCIIYTTTQVVVTSHTILLIRLTTCYTCFHTTSHFIIIVTSTYALSANNNVLPPYI
jgi:hypothetical protein